METKNLKRKVRETGKMHWIAAMERKPGLSNYRKGKYEISKYTFYDSSRGSALLCEARLGCLRMLSYKARLGEEEKCTDRER